MERYATVILLLLFFSASVFGKTIGEVTYLKGDGMLSRLKEEYDLAEKLGVELEVGDR